MAKVLLISGSWPPARCGVGIYTEHFYRQISQNRSLEFELFTTKGFTPQQPKSYSTPAWRIRDIPAMLQAIRKSQPDVIHIQYPTLLYKRQVGINLLPWLLRLRGHRIVLTMHEYFQTSLLGRIRSVITALPARQIVVSNQADAASLPFFLKGKVRIIPIGSNIAMQKPQAARFNAILARAHLSHSRQTVVFFGFPFPNKRLERLIDTAKQFSDKLQLLLIFDVSSDDPYVKQLLTRVTSAIKDGARIGLAGYLDDSDVSITLSSAEYFVLPQDHPPLTAKSGTAIAACTHGCVVIATEPRPATLGEPFVSGENCLLLTEITAEKLARTLNELSEDEATRKKLKDAAQALRNYFGWSGVTDRYIKLYGEL